MIKNNIDVKRSFQSSINIAYDLNDEKKIKDFIPTKSSINFIEDIFYSITGDESRARILIGSYGRGKSHLVLVMMALLSKRNIQLFSELLDKIRDYNILLYEHIKEYFYSGDKILPIVIKGNDLSLKQSFLNTLYATLKDNNLLDIMPETNYSAAINTIKKWENEYAETHEKFVSEINMNINDFISSLEEFDIQNYNLFLKLYTKLTSGSEFNPFLGFDVVDIYEKVSLGLKDKGYSGLYVIYDEFSKYLESSISNATIDDIKLLQDFAEKCDRSKNFQLHLMLISHKDLSNYIDKKLPKKHIDGWRGVSGRFKHINIHNDYSQTYEVISHAIKKEERFWDKFRNDNNNNFNDIKKALLSLKLFDIEEMDIVIDGCYPLHPISTYVLPRLSEKVAQNERTLFTFLSTNEKNTLKTFIDNSDDLFPVLTPDYIYDYFEILLRKEHYDSITSKIYRIAKKVIEKIKDNELGKKIVKTIAIIYLIEDFDKLKPDLDIIIKVYTSQYNIKDINTAIDSLIKNDCVIYLNRSDGFLKIKEHSSINIQKEINYYVEKSKNTFQLKKVLNKIKMDSYLYPTAYNDENEIIRYFEFSFINFNEFNDVDNWEIKIENSTSDGVIYAILPNSDDDIAKIKLKLDNCNINNDRIVFIFPKKFVEIENLAKEYQVVLDLIEKYREDNLTLDELNIYLEDLDGIIKEYIYSYTKPEYGTMNYYHNGRSFKCNRKAHLSSKLSEICNILFPNTPIINNETVNKNHISSVTLKSRNKVISKLLDDEIEFNLGLSGNGQEISILRSILIQTKILENEELSTRINLNPEDEKIRNVLKIISDFFIDTDTDKEKNFKDLYDILKSPQFGIGLRSGVIPIFIATVIHKYKKRIVIKNKDLEIATNFDSLNLINENPENFSVFLVKWDNDKENYLTKIEQLFQDYIIEKEKNINSFSFIVQAMSRWFLSLPQYSKELKYIYLGLDQREKLSKNEIILISALKNPSLNAKEFLFTKLPEIYNFKNFNCESVNFLKESKKILDYAKNNLINGLILDLKVFFDDSKDNSGNSLITVIKDWYEALDEITKNHLFNNNEDKLLKIMSNISNDEIMFIEEIAKLTTGLRIDDWNDNTINLFKNEILQFRDNVINFNNNSKNIINKSNIYNLSFVSATGEETNKTFSKNDYSPRAKLLMNELYTSIEEMGKSITVHEKRQVLIELLENLC